MACDIISGWVNGCEDGVGGIETIYITELANLSTFTADTSGNVSIFTLSTGKKFYQLEVQKEHCSFTEAITGSAENGTTFYAQTLTMKRSKLSANDRYLLQLISKNRVMIIVKDNNGNYLLMGKTGAKLTSANAMTGQALGDFNGYDALTFVANEPNPMYFVDSSLISTLTTPA